SIYTSINRVRDSLYSGHTGKNVWYKNDTFLIEEDMGKIRVLERGNYSVVAFDGHGCSESSDYFFVSELANQPLDFSVLKIYPNPGSGNYRIEASAEYGTLEIFNQLGQQIQIIEINDKSNLRFQLSESGIFTLVFRSENQIYSAKLVNLN